MASKINVTVRPANTINVTVKPKSNSDRVNLSVRNSTADVTYTEYNLDGGTF